MKSLLVVFMFTLSPQGEPQPVGVVTESFETAEQCNFVGRNLRELITTIPDNVKTLSYCVSPDEF